MSKARPSPEIVNLIKTCTIQQLEREIEKQRIKVNHAYYAYGVGHPNYEQPFDDLHFLRMWSMASKYRMERGLHQTAGTPYDDKDLLVALEDS